MLLPWPDHHHVNKARYRQAYKFANSI
jgi:hypothetical protein